MTDPIIVIINGPLNGTGTYLITPNTELQLNGSVASTEIIQFTAGPSELILGDPSEFDGTIASFSATNTIDITTIPFSTQISTSIVSNTLEILGTIPGQEIFLNFDTITSTESFQITPDASTGIFITEIACFLKNTSISVKSGKTLVQDLKIGDHVITEMGKEVPIKWIGTRTYRQPFTVAQRTMFPILIKKDAIAHGLPSSDLYISPEHSIFISGYFVPAKALINEKTIIRVSSLSEISYFHIELDRHDVIFAEDLAVETFCDCYNRKVFDNYHEYKLLYGEDTSDKAAYAYPKLENGSIVEEIKRDIAQKAGFTKNIVYSEHNLKFQGFIDGADHSEVRGWAWFPDFPERAVELEIFVDQGLIARITADLFRPDLVQAEIGTGNHGFSLHFNRVLLPHHKTVDVRVAQNGRSLAKSPILLEPIFDRETTNSEVRKEYNRCTKKISMEKERVLILDSVWPEKCHSAGSDALFSHIRIFQKFGYQIDLMAFSLWAPKVMEELRSQNINPIIHSEFASVESLLQNPRSKYSIVYLNKIQVAKRYCGLIRDFGRDKHNRPSFTIYNIADLHFLRTHREAYATKNRQLYDRAKRVLFDEFLAMQQVDCVIAHSPIEAHYITQKLPTIKPHVVPWSFRTKKIKQSFESRSGISFIGSFSHAPNRDAIEWLTSEIMPLIWMRSPTLNLNIFGSGWTEKSFPVLDERIKIRGKIRDLYKNIQKTRVCIAPLRFGAGIKGKVLDSLACGVPIVMSPCAAEGLHLSVSYQNVICESASQISQKIIELHDDEEVNHRFSIIGHQIVEHFYSEKAVERLMTKALKDSFIDHGRAWPK